MGSKRPPAFEEYKAYVDVLMGQLRHCGSHGYHPDALAPILYDLAKCEYDILEHYGDHAYARALVKLAILDSACHLGLADKRWRAELGPFPGRNNGGCGGK